MDTAVKHFCISSFFIDGRKQYEILHANMSGGIPSARTIQNRIEKLSMRLKEGEINALAVKNFLVENNLPLVVAVSQDGTTVSGRRKHYSNWNGIVGCSLPLSPNGLPHPKAGIDKNAADIANIFYKYDRATVAMVVVIQTMKNEGPRFVCAHSAQTTNLPRRT